MQAFGEGFGEAVGERFGHDRVVVVVVGSELVAQLLQADAAGYCERADVIGQPGFLWRDEVGERPARLAPFPVRLLAEKVESIENFFSCAVGVEFDVVADCAGGKEAVYATCGDEVLLDDAVEESVGIGEELAGLLTLLRVLKDAGPAVAATKLVP